ncbi:hypothetical protein [Hyphomonas sp.]|uniref:hypothetical protein n=1 Tax=Hyphomonas sp. TaxID=87 RepID=UPI0025BF3D3B|nr:hypothetical protein [Hyphomonas sp.]
MVAYSFKQRFADPIEQRTKLQTIRLDRKRHARKGEELQLYQGMRTRHCRLLRRATCTLVCDIEINWKPPVIIRLDKFIVLAERGMLEDFARKDGFEDLADMRAFWEAEHPGLTIFRGKLIRWEA